jgi:hypothetical protein
MVMLALTGNTQSALDVTFTQEQQCTGDRIGYFIYPGATRQEPLYAIGI